MPPSTAPSPGRQNPVLTATYQQVNARLQALRFRSNQDDTNGKPPAAEMTRWLLR
jgi:hypothetical protein